MKRFLVMDVRDNVATALENAHRGDTIVAVAKDGKVADQLTAAQDILFGNKVCLRNLSVGEKVFKYGVAVGECTADTKRGELVHVHNVKSLKVELPLSTKREVMRLMGIVPQGGGHANI